MSVMSTATHIVVDLETLGNHPMHGMIMSLGAVRFTMDEPYTSIIAPKNFIHTNHELYMVIDMNKQQELYGWNFDAETLRWWIDSEEKVELLRQLVNNKQALHVGEAFQLLRQWISAFGGNQETRYLWSHGATFDCMHLALKWPQVMGDVLTSILPFRNIRDTRTLFALYQETFGEKVPYAPSTLRHHALVDAMNLATAIQHAWKRIKANATVGG